LKCIARTNWLITAVILLIAVIFCSPIFALGTGGRNTYNTSATATTAWTWQALSLTSGNMLKLVLDDDTVNGGLYLQCLGGTTHSTAVFTIGEGGVVGINPTTAAATVDGIGIAGTYQTTADGLQISKVDATNTTGKYINCLGGTGTTAVFTVGENGATIITPNLNTANALTVDGGTTTTTGDLLTLSVDDDNAAAGFLYLNVVGGASKDTTVASIGEGGTLTAAGQVTIGRTAKKVPIIGATKTDFDAQAATLTIAGLLGGFVTQNSKVGASTATTPTGTEISAGITGAAAGDSFTCVFYNRGNQTTTITAGASGVTVLGTAAVPTLRAATLYFLCTAANTWEVYVVLSA
jgi:hypothetical protein